MVTKEQIVKLVQENDEALYRALPHFAGAAVHPFVHGIAKQYMKKGKLSLKQIAALRKFLKGGKDNMQIDVLFAASLKKQVDTAIKRKEADKQLGFEFGRIEAEIANDI